jgi:hypothetical protein
MVQTNRTYQILAAIVLLAPTIAFSQVSTVPRPALIVEQPVAPAQVRIQLSDLEITEKVWLNAYSTVKPELYDVQTKKVNNAVVDTGVTLPSLFTPYAVTGYEQKKPFAFIQIPRYIRQASGDIYEIVSYKYRYTETNPVRKTRGSRVYAAHSVLSSGTWHKISVNANGIHKVDFDFVKTKLNIDPATINVQNISLYGNGGTMLSENNAIVREDDLAENHVQLIGMADGVWNAGDYILFYASGPHDLVKDSANQKFSHSYNLYNTLSYYFLNFDKGAGARVQVASPSTLPAAPISTFSDYQYIESDEYNFGKFGKLWWGHRFGSSTFVSKTFNLPALNAVGTGTLQMHLGAVGTSGNSIFAAGANQTNLGTVALGYIGNEFYDPTIRAQLASYTVNGASTGLDVTLQFSPGNDFSSGYVDYISLNIRRQLKHVGSAMRFRDWQSISTTTSALYQIQASQAIEVWDITDPLRPQAMQVTANGTTYSFTSEASRLHEFISFDGLQFNTPSYVGLQANQDIHGLGATDFVIIYNAAFKAEATRLAAYHTAKGLRVAAIDLQAVYNEFSGASQDVAALRDCVKMFYDRATTAADMPQQLLLFGDASYDYKDRVETKTNFVPTHETRESISKILGYCSDDFFGMLDDNENINNFGIANTLDIGVGRIPSKTSAEARAAVDKVIAYESPSSFGPWKNNFTFCSDNGDGSVHAQDAEIMSNTTKQQYSNANIYKVYVDAYPLVSTPAGDRAIQAKQALDANMYNGTILVNYNGHGGPSAWCEERLFIEADINNYTNIHKLPLFITATCDFAPFDNPAVYSAGEKLLLYDKGGAIALMTTTQLVYQNENRVMNRNYMNVAFKPMTNGKMPSFGDAYRMSKNITYANALSESVAANYRKFALLGDPALHLSLPQLRVVADSLNGKPLLALADTLKALNQYKISGRVLDNSGNTNTGFNGTVNISIFDKARKLETLSSTAASPKINYELQNAVVFRGSATVTNGIYSVTFKVPKDIDYNVGRGKISMYAYSSTVDATGADTNIIIGGVGNALLSDDDGPLVRPFMNTNRFINGGITAPNSTLLVELSDSNGINTTGTSVGHDITAVLDGKVGEPIVLNTFYESAKDDFTQGTVRFPLKGLAVGPHTLTVKAWDILNNSGVGTVDFVVQASEEAQIDRVVNYPNPFTTSTSFGFDHNQSGVALYITIEIYSVSGAMVKTIQTISGGESSRVDNIGWDGTDQYGDKLGRGTYLYQVYYKTSSGKSAFKYQKLVIL